MRIVYYTRSNFRTNEIFRYIYARVSTRFPDGHVLVFRPERRGSLAKKLRRWRRKVGVLGVLSAIEIITSYPLQWYFIRQDRRWVKRGLQALPRPASDLDTCRTVEVDGLNSPATAEVLRGLAPDVMIQIGAGILKPVVFSVPRLGTLNMHHGIAPLIRGILSIYWALWERKPEWIGSTVHMIDEGIDTGRVLAYGKVEPGAGRSQFPPLYVEATRKGVEALMKVLEALAEGRDVTSPTAAGKSEYRSTFSGWKMLLLRLRQLSVSAHD